VLMLAWSGGTRRPSGGRLRVLGGVGVSGRGRGDGLAALPTGHVGLARKNCIQISPWPISPSSFFHRGHPWVHIVRCQMLPGPYKKRSRQEPHLCPSSVPRRAMRTQQMQTAHSLASVAPSKLEPVPPRTSMAPLTVEMDAKVRSASHCRRSELAHVLA
jgi:hypothetical protein